MWHLHLVIQHRKWTITMLLLWHTQHTVFSSSEPEWLRLKSSVFKFFSWLLEMCMYICAMTKLVYFIVLFELFNWKIVVVAQTGIIWYHFACILQGIYALSVFHKCCLIAFLTHFLGLRSFASFIAFYRTLVSANNFVSSGYLISYIFSAWFFLDSSG